MDRGLVIHIGDPKTGTSSIQRALQLDLVKSEEALVSGFTNRLGSANAINFARSFYPLGNLHRCADEVSDWIRAHPGYVKIVSSEFFIDSDPALLQSFLDSRFPDLSRNLKVIAYVRPHIGRALSAFTERTKAGYTLASFDKWLENFICSGSLHYSPRFLAWRRVFGSGFVLRPYIPSEITDGDVVLDFFREALDGRSFSVGRSLSENKKISLKGLSGLRAFNSRLSEEGVIAKRRIPLSLMISRKMMPGALASRPAIGSANIKKIANSCRNDALQIDNDFFSRPLLSSDLLREEESFSEPNFDLSLDRNFTAVEISEIDRLLAPLPSLVNKQFHEWRSFYKKYSSAQNMGRPIYATFGEFAAQSLKNPRLFSPYIIRPSEIYNRPAFVGSGGEIQKRIQRFAEIIS